MGDGDDGAHNSNLKTFPAAVKKMDLRLSRLLEMGTSGRWAGTGIHLRGGQQREVTSGEMDLLW